MLGESVTLDWTASCGATEYEVDFYYWKTSTSSWQPYFLWTTPDDFKQVWPVVEADFYFRVRAKDGAAVGDWSVDSYFSWANPAP